MEILQSPAPSKTVIHGADVAGIWEMTDISADADYAAD